jgi:hypothetical protein
VAKAGGDIPIEQPKQIRVGRHLRTAKAIGIELPTLLMGWTPRSRQSCRFCMHVLLGLEVQSKVSGQVIFVDWKNSLFAQPARFAHNALVGGSNPPSHREVSLRLPKGPQLAGSDVGVSVSVETFSGLEAILGELSLALGIPFPGNGDRCQQRRGSNVSTVQSNPASDAAATIRREGRRAGPRPFRGGAAHRSPP